MKNLCFSSAAAEEPMRINHLDFPNGDPCGVLAGNAESSGVRGGVSGLIIDAAADGEDADGRGQKAAEKALPVPPGFMVSSVRVRHELTSEESFISQIRTAQVQDPPDTAVILSDNGTDLTNPGPICVDSVSPPEPIAPSAGSLLPGFHVDFANPADELSDGDPCVIRKSGLHLIPHARLPVLSRPPA